MNGDDMNPPADESISLAATGLGQAPPVWPMVDSSQLLEGRSQIYIAHGNVIYTLRLTRGDKLILTK